MVATSVFAFAGGHFGDLAVVQRNAADELHVKRNHLPEHGMAAHDHFRFALRQPAAGVFDDGKGFGQNFVERGGQFLLVLNRRQARLPVGGFLAQLVVGKLLEAGLDLVDLVDNRPEFFHFAVIPRPEDQFYEPNHDNLRK